MMKNKDECALRVTGYRHGIIVYDKLQHCIHGMRGNKSR